MGYIFISYAREDKDYALKIYNDLLSGTNLHPWLDIKNLLPGQNWKLEIQNAIRESDIFIACLSNNSVSKKGYVQAELKKALEILETFPEGDVYIIPVRFDDCTVPTSLAHLQWLDYFEVYGEAELIKVITTHLDNKSNSFKSDRGNETSDTVAASNPGESSVMSYVMINNRDVDEDRVKTLLFILQDMGEYLVKQIPMNLDNMFFIELETKINDLYIELDKELNKELSKYNRKALSVVLSFLEDEIIPPVSEWTYYVSRNPDTSRPAELLKNVKRIGRNIRDLSMRIL